MQSTLWEIQEEAIGRSFNAADDAWIAEARQITIDVCIEQKEFTSDDIWKKGLPIPDEPRALGGVFRQLARESIITRTDRVKTSVRHQRNHGRQITIWASEIWGT